MSFIPELTLKQREEGYKKAQRSERKRHAFILHESGDYHNRVFNFLLNGTYMQPHSHPGPEKIEQIYLVDGVIDLIFFDDVGALQSVKRMDPNGCTHVSVPAFQNHTYRVHSLSAITYETMDGVYDPHTWKRLCGWAPSEGEGSVVQFCKDLDFDTEKVVKSVQKKTRQV